MLVVHKLIVESDPETDNKSDDQSDNQSEDESDVDDCSNVRKKDKKRRPINCSTRPTPLMLVTIRFAPDGGDGVME